METPSLTKRIAFILFIFACSTSITHAAEPLPTTTIGQVVWVKNTLKAQQPNAKARVLARRSEIYEHDTLMTDTDSSGEIAFTDDSELALQENSTVKIDQYKHGNGNPPDKDAFVVNVLKGGFRTVTGAISKNNPGGYVATTPVATIGVSGTIYSIYYNASKKSMAAKIDKGSIKVANKNGEVTLTKCSANSKGVGSTPCVDKLYAEVTNADATPKAVAEQPIEFNNEPILTTTPQSNQGGLVGSFCIN